LKAFFVAIFGAITVLLMTGASFAAPVPLRHLVYNFKVGIQSSATQHDSGFSGDGGGGGSGVSDSKSSSADEGQIVIDVTGASADGGIELSVSESAKETRSSVPTTCVVYGANLAIICDQNGKVNDEEFAIIRYIGRNFIAPGAITAGSKWQVADTLSSGTELNNFTVTSSQDGLITIDEARTQKVAGAGGFDQTITGTIAYNAKYTVPTALHEMAVKRQNQGAQDYMTVRTFTDLTLASDSMQPKQ